MTISEVAAELRVTPKTAYNWVRSGQLPATRIGRTWRVSIQDVKKW